MSAEPEILEGVARLQGQADPVRSGQEILAEIESVVEEIETRWPDGEPEDASGSLLFNILHLRLTNLQWELDEAVDCQPPFELTLIRGSRDA